MSAPAILTTATMNGHFEFHHDESLDRNGSTATFVTDSRVNL